ncbi:MAG: hypothetical protein DWC08_03015 [Candidatus Poseidoniales archaeon]|nr:MAG: hypothetical protein DWC08_03015 [Candidatus Poseidoniales archaeon]
MAIHRKVVVDVRNWLQSTKSRGMALGLKGTKTVLERLNLSLPANIIHVAGSNGKGTVCALMSTALGLADVEHVMFTSPHVVRIEERIRRNCTPVSSKEFDQALEVVFAASQGEGIDSCVDLTFFEVTYLVAMVCSQGSEVLILETGLGGRLDATRSGPATVSLVTSVSCEHTDILGDDLPSIAREKAAICRPNRTLFVREPQRKDVLEAILEEAHSAGNAELGEIPAPAHPIAIPIRENASVREEAAILAKAVLQSLHFPTGVLEKADLCMRWPARMQLLSIEQTSSHPYLLDAAHNPSGITRILPELENCIVKSAPHVNKKPVWSLLLGTSPQHDLAQFLSPLLRLCEQLPPQQIVITEPQGGRYQGVPVSQLTSFFESKENLHSYSKPSDALHALSQLDREEVGLVVSLGSLYLQGNILKSFGLTSDEFLSLYAKQ